jgi:hypothetical protein
MTITKGKKAGKDMGRKETLCTVGGNINECNHYGNQWRFLKKLKIELPYILLYHFWVYAP